MSDITGEWDGMLLENNGWIMSSISHILTNYLFSKNREWIGKAFHGNNDETTKNVYIGKNRFVPKMTKEQNTKSTLNAEMDRTFEYELSPSVFDSRTSLKLKYTNHVPNPVSWMKTMVDELRFVEVVVDDNEKKNKAFVLLGMGSMAWSGGAWNAAPFLLMQ